MRKEFASTRNIGTFLVNALLIVLMVFWGGCGCDSFEKVPAMHKCVLMELPWRGSADGGTITPKALGTGNQNLGDSSENMALFISLAQHIAKIRIQVLMKDELNQDVELALNYQVIDDRLPDLVVNYINSYKKTKDLSWVYMVDLKSIVDTNILPSFDMISRMVVSQYDSSSIPRETLKDEILRQLRARLSKITRPKVTVNSQGNVVYTKEQIAITDVIRLLSVDIGAMPAPAPVQEVIQQIESANARLKEVKADMERARLEREGVLTEAKHVAVANRKITENWTPNLRKYYWQKLLVEYIPQAKNCEVIYVPEDANLSVFTSQK